MRHLKCLPLTVCVQTLVLVLEATTFTAVEKRVPYRKPFFGGAFKIIFTSLKHFKTFDLIVYRGNALGTPFGDTHSRTPRPRGAGTSKCCCLGQVRRKKCSAFPWFLLEVFFFPLKFLICLGLRKTPFGFFWAIFIPFSGVLKHISQSRRPFRSRYSRIIVAPFVPEGRGDSTS